MRRLGRVAVAAALGGVVIGLPVTASARLTNSASETNRFTAGSLATPATPTTIHPNVTGSGDGDVRLTWTDSLTRAVTYLVQRAPVATPTSWTTVNGGGSGQGSATLCSGTVPGAVSCTYDDNAANSTTAPAYNQSYVYQVVSKVGGWTKPSTGRLAESLPPGSASETYLVEPDLNAVSGTAANSVWAVGNECSVVYYNGTTWTPQTVPASVCPAGTALNGVYAASATAVWVVGANGVAFECTAGCATAAPTWANKTTSGSGSPTLYGISGTSGTAVWAVGANCAVLYGTGSAWTTLTVGTTYCASGTTLYGVAADGGKPTIAGAAGTLFTCTGTCTTATPALKSNTPASLASTTFYGVYAGSTSAVWAVGTGGAYALCSASCTATNATWTAQSTGSTATLRAVAGASTAPVYAAGDSDTVLKCAASCNSTTAASWSAQATSTGQTLRGAWAASGFIVTVGTQGAAAASDGWAPVATGTSNDLYAVSAASATSAWAVGANCTVLWSNGATWTAQTVPTSACPTGTTLYGVDAAAGKPIIVGAGGVAFQCKATSCTGSAPTWTAITAVTSNTLYAVSANTSAIAWAVGANCTLLYYNGTAWTAQTAGVCPAGTTLYAVTQNNKLPVAAGAAGTMFTCSAGCTTAAPTLTSTPPPGMSTTTWRGLQYGSASAVWAVGSGGAIAVCTANCGKTNPTWTQQTSGTTANLNAVSALSTTTVDTVGDGGELAECVTGCAATTGYAWNQLTSNTTTNLTGVADTATLQFAVGLGGASFLAGVAGTLGTVDPGMAHTVPYTVTLAAADLTALSAPDGTLYTGHWSWPSTALPTTCTSSTPAVTMVPAPTIPSGTWTVSKAVATVIFQVNAVPSGGAAFQLLVSPDSGSTWTAYSVTTPTAAAAPARTTVDITTTIGTTTALQNARLCLQGSSGSGPALTSSVDLIHLDVN